MPVSRTVSEIFSVNEQRYLETGSFKVIENKMALFDSATFYWSAIVNIALSCTIFELFDVE